MRNSRLIILLIFLLFLALTVYNLLRNRYSTLGPEMQNLALPDPARISEVILQGPLSRPENSVALHLVKRDNEWFVNDSIPAKPGLVVSFLQAAASISIKAPLPGTKARAVKKRMESEGTQAIFLAGKSSVRHYYVVSDTEGSYILQKGRGKPVSFVIPGFPGNPAGIFTAQTDFWEDVALHPLFAGDLKEARLQYADKPNLSFSLNKTGHSAWSLTDFQGMVRKIPDKSLALKDFLISLRRIPGTIPTDSSMSKAIELSLNQGPFAVLTTVCTPDSVTVAFYRYLSETPCSVRPDPYLCIARSSRDCYILLVKYTDLDNLLMEPSDFQE